MSTSTEVASLIAKLSLDTSGFSSAVRSLDTNSVQKSVQSAVDDIDIDIKHFNLATEADELREENAAFGEMLDTMDMAHNVSIAIADEMGTWISTARDVETAWVGVTKTVTNVPEGVDPDKFFSDLKADVYQMSTEMPRTFQEIAAAMSAAGQIGIKPEMLHSYTEAMLQFESATNGAIKAATATTIFGKLQNVTGGAQEDISRLASSVVALGNNTATDEKHILDMANAIAGAGAYAGLTDAQIMGWSAALSSVGLESGRAGTAFSTLIRSMNQSVALGDEKLTVFAATAGMTAEEFQTLWGQDTSKAMQAFFSGMGTAAEEDVSALYSSLEELGINQSQGIAIAEKLSSATDTVNNSLLISETAYSENSALANEAAEANNTLDAQMQMFENTITAIQGQLGESLLPVIKEIADALLPILSGASAFIAEHPDLAGTITYVAIAFEGLAVAAQVASVAMALGSMGLAPWIGAVAIIGALVGVVVLLADAFSQSHEMAAATLEDIENMDPAIDQLQDIAGTTYISSKFFNDVEAVDINGEEFGQGTWVQWDDQQLGWIRATEEEAAKLNARLEETATLASDTADAFTEDSIADSVSEQMTETTEAMETTATSTDDLMTQLNEQMSTYNQTMEQFSSTTGENLTSTMDQLNSTLESEAFKQFASQPVSEDVTTSWTAFGDAVSAASDGFSAISTMAQEESGLTLPLVPEETMNSWKAFGDLLGGNEEEGTVGLVTNLENVKKGVDAILTSMQNLAAYMVGDFLAAGSTLIQFLAVPGEDGEAGGGNTLYNSLGSVSGVLGDIHKKSQDIVEEWSGAFISAAEALRQESGRVEGALAGIASEGQCTADAFFQAAAAVQTLLQALMDLDAYKKGRGGSTSGGSGSGIVSGNPGLAAADGARVHAGETWLVGEEGPELFTPHRSGYIIPNDELRGSGGPSVTVNIEGSVYGESYLDQYVVGKITRAVRRELTLAA